MSFKPSRAIAGCELKYGLIDNSETLSVGEVIIPGIQGDTSVVKTGGGTTGDLLGVVMGIIGNNSTGKVMEFDTYAAESDNVTDKMVKVSYIPLYHPIEWEVDLDAAAETTDNSSGFGNFAVDANGTKLDEDTYVAFGTKTNKQFFSFGLVDSGSTTLVSARCIAAITA